jgi:hypothetical protein
VDQAAAQAVIRRVAQGFIQLFQAAQRATTPETTAFMCLNTTSASVALVVVASTAQALETIEAAMVEAMARAAAAAAMQHQAHQETAAMVRPV